MQNTFEMVEIVKAELKSIAFRCCSKKGASISTRRGVCESGRLMTCINSFLP